MGWSSWGEGGVGVLYGPGEFCRGVPVPYGVVGPGGFGPGEFRGRGPAAYASPGFAAYGSAGASGIVASRVCGSGFRGVPRSLAAGPGSPAGSPGAGSMSCHSPSRRRNRPPSPTPKNTRVRHSGSADRSRHLRVAVYSSGVSPCSAAPARSRPRLRSVRRCSPDFRSPRRPALMSSASRTWLRPTARPIHRHTSAAARCAPTVALAPVAIATRTSAFSPYPKRAVSRASRRGSPRYRAESPRRLTARRVLAPYRAPSRTVSATRSSRASGSARGRAVGSAS
ncbi:hypothetical protein a10_09548 [Streptomyces acidiscabies]|nr:hypothetical protein a10_09548 [Streptomyces acidiscabies]